MDHPVVHVAFEDVEAYAGDLEARGFFTVASGAGTRLELTAGAGIAAGPCFNDEEVVHDPHLAARNMLVEVDDPVTGPLKLAGNPMKFSAFADPSIREPAPDLDADRQKVLRELGLEG